MLGVQAGRLINVSVLDLSVGVALTEVLVVIFLFCLYLLCNVSVRYLGIFFSKKNVCPPRRDLSRHFMGTCATVIVGLLFFRKTPEGILY